MSIASKAWLKYVDEVWGDSTNLYYCSRLLEKAYLLLSDPDSVTLMRKAAMTVYKFDPLAYITTYMHEVDMLSDDELEGLTTALDIVGEDDLTNYQHGKLWSDVANSGNPSWVIAQRGCQCDEISSNHV